MRIGTVSWTGWLLSRSVLGQDDPRPSALKADLTSANLHSPPSTALRIATLRRALDRDDWTGVSGFYATVAEVLRIAEVKAHSSHPQYPDLCRIVAELWLKSLESDERVRLYRVTTDRAAELASMSVTDREAVPALLAAPEAFSPNVGDKTVADLITAYRLARIEESGERETHKRYTHIFKALEETLGPDTVLKTITREDCRRVRDFLRNVPKNASKVYRGLTLAQAVAQGVKDDVQRISGSTLNAYLINLSATMNWAVREEWIARNPAGGVVVKSSPVVKRRGFSPEELLALFDHLKLYSSQEAWKWWVPAMGLYTGARLNEILQLRRSDVRCHTQIHYIAITEYESDGSRRDKKLKNDASERNVPIHNALVGAGLLELSEQSRGPLLFSDLPIGPRGTSTIVSKWFGRELEGAGMADPSLVFHSFRHGFRDAAEAAGISDRTVKALGGWATRDVSERYGNRGHLPTLAEAMSRITYGDFCLPRMEEARS